jgi:heat shock protein HslJ
MALRRKMIYAWMGILLIVSGACSSQVLRMHASGRELIGTQWELNSFGPQGSELAVADGAHVTLAFTGETEVGGTDGCNTFDGEYEAKFGGLSFRNLTSTRVVCTDKNLLHQQMEYLQALSKTDRYEVQGNQLTIWYGQGRYTLIFTRSQPPGLVGARFDKG